MNKQPLGFANDHCFKDVLEREIIFSYQTPVYYAIIRRFAFNVRFDHYVRIIFVPSVKKFFSTLLPFIGIIANIIQKIVFDRVIIEKRMHKGINRGWHSVIVLCLTYFIFMVKRKFMYMYVIHV